MSMKWFGPVIDLIGSHVKLPNGNMSSSQALNEVHHWKSISSNTIEHCHVAISRHFLPHSVPTFRSVLGMMLHNHWAIQPCSNPGPNGELHEKPDDCLKSKPLAAANPTASPFNKNNDCWQTQLRSHESRVLLIHGVSHWRVMTSHTASMQLSFWIMRWWLYRMILQPKLNNCSAKTTQLRCCVPV